MGEIEESEELQLSALKEMIRIHLFNTEIYAVKSKSNKGGRTFQKAAQRFQEFAEGTFHISDSTEYKKFDRQRKFMLKHLLEKLPSQQSEATQFILGFVAENDISRKRDQRIAEAGLDDKINPEIVHSQIETEICIRALYNYLDQQGTLVQINVQDFIVDPVCHGLLNHCQYNLFKLEMFRTKKHKKGSLHSLYCQNVSSI
jgi:hypothetical protein